MRVPLRLVATLFLISLLVACAAPRAPQRLPSSNSDIESFGLSGRVAVRADDRGYSASLRWKHHVDADSLRLFSPLGTVIAKVEVDAQGAVLTTGDRKEYRSDDVQALTRQVLGWDLPLSGLQHWVLGRADPKLPVEAEARDAGHRLTRLSQNGWRITYLEYAGDSALPARMALAHDRLSLRLIVDRWDLPE